MGNNRRSCTDEALLYIEDSNEATPEVRLAASVLERGLFDAIGALKSIKMAVEAGSQEDYCAADARCSIRVRLEPIRWILSCDTAPRSAKWWADMLLEGIDDPYITYRDIFLSIVWQNELQNILTDRLNMHYQDDVDLRRLYFIHSRKRPYSYRTEL